MATVTVVEYRDADGSEVVHIASSKEKALAFIKCNTDSGGEGHWEVYEEQIDGDIPEVRSICCYDRNGNVLKRYDAVAEHLFRQAAWNAVRLRFSKNVS